MQHLQPRLTTLLFGSLVLLLSCRPGVDLNGLNPPEFTESYSLVVHSETGIPLGIEIMAPFSFVGTPFELVAVECDFALSRTPNGFLADSYSEYEQFQNPLPGDAADHLGKWLSCWPNDPSENIFDGRLVAYRWVVTYKLKNGGEELLQTQSQVYLMTAAPSARDPSITDVNDAIEDGGQPDFTNPHWHQDTLLQDFLRNN